MNAQIQSDLDLIRESVLQAVSAEAIYLFGSHAYGHPRDDSDLDIYVVAPDDTPDMGELYADILALIRRKKKYVGIDLLMGRASAFNRRKVGSTLERVIAQKGALLHGT